MQVLEREIAKARKAERIVDELGHGTVIVEGKHDISALACLGINAISYEKFMHTHTTNNSSQKFYIFTDNDKGGYTKKEKLISHILSLDSTASINSEKPQLLLRMLGAKCVEEIVRPMEKIREISG